MALFPLQIHPTNQEPSSGNADLWYVLRILEYGKLTVLAGALLARAAIYNASKVE